MTDGAPAEHWRRLMTTYNHPEGRAGTEPETLPSEVDRSTYAPRPPLCVCQGRVMKLF